VGTKAGKGDNFNNQLALGVTTDPAKSGMVAEAIYDKTNYRHGVYCIHVYDEVTPSSKLDADAFTENVERLIAEMRLHAKVDLTNVSGSADFVVETKFNEDDTWYRLYKSGWVEQGGWLESPSSKIKAHIVTFPVKMANTKYIAAVYPTHPGADSNLLRKDNNPIKLTVNSMEIVRNAGDTNGMTWKVEGQAAEVPQWGSTNV
jgi:hypothetical protein